MPDDVGKSVVNGSANRTTKPKLYRKLPTIKQLTQNQIKSTIFIKSSTPFVSGIKRITKFLDNLAKKKFKNAQVRYVTILGMGKAVEKTLSLGLYFEQEKFKRIEVYTKTVEVIDEMFADEEESEEINDNDRETTLKKRLVSGIEIRIFPDQLPSV